MESETCRLALTRARTSSDATPGASSRNSNPTSLTSMTASSVTIRVAHRAQSAGRLHSSTQTRLAQVVALSGRHHAAPGAETFDIFGMGKEDPAVPSHFGGFNDAEVGLVPVATCLDDFNRLGKMRRDQLGDSLSENHAGAIVQFPKNSGNDDLLGVYFHWKAGSTSAGTVPRASANGEK